MGEELGLAVVREGEGLPEGPATHQTTHGGRIVQELGALADEALRGDLPVVRDLLRIHDGLCHLEHLAQLPITVLVALTTTTMSRDLHDGGFFRIEIDQRVSPRPRVILT